MFTGCFETFFRLQIFVIRFGVGVIGRFLARDLAVVLTNFFSTIRFTVLFQFYIKLKILNCVKKI